MVKKIVFISLCIGLMLVLGAIVTWLYLPTYIEHRILPQILEQAGIDNANCPVRSAGLFGADLGPLRIGKKNNRPVTIDSIQLDFSPLGLYRKRIRSVRLAGIDLFGTYDQGRFNIHGLEPILFSASPKKNPPANPEKQPINIPVHIEKLKLTHTVFHLAWGRNNLYIPVSISIHSPTDNPKIYNSRLSMIIFGEEVQIDTQVSLDGPVVSLNLNSKPLAVAPLIGLFDLGDSILGNALVRIKSQLKATLSPFTISGITFEAFFENLNLLAGNVRLGSLPGDGLEKQPPHFKAVQIDTGRWQIALNKILVRGPGEPELRISAINANVQRKSGGNIHLDGQLFGAIPPFKSKSPAPIQLNEALTVKTAFSGNGTVDGPWQFELKSRKPPQEQKPVSLITSGIDFSCSPPAIRIDASGDETGAAARLDVQIPIVNLSTDIAKLDFHKLSLTGELTAKRSEDSIRPRLTFSLKTSKIKGWIASATNRQHITFKIPEINFAASGQANPPQVDGNLTISGMTIVAPEYDGEIKEIAAKIPLQWPVPKKGKSGRIILEGTRLGSRNLGTTSVQLTQNSRGYAFRGDHANPILPKLAIHFSGETLLIPPIKPHMLIRLKVNRSPDAPDIDLGRITDTAKGITANGDFQAEGRFRVSENGAIGDICLKVDNGRVRIPDKETSVDGLQGQLCLPALPKIRSAPQQPIAFDELAVGKIRIHNGTLNYQIESPKDIFIEKGKMKWCSGTVRLGAMRIRSNKEEYQIRLDCDRLNLAQILDQFGLADAEGSGTLNGSVPIRFQNGKLTFDDGFLYSTPGVGGKIRLTGTQSLTAGIPEGSVQFNQIDLAREALEDYDYNWAKLGLNTLNDELIMRLQFDGKPAKILPFEFKKEFGGFVRIDTDGRGSNFQGISLDVNFRIPLDDLLQYKDVLQHLE